MKIATKAQRGKNRREEAKKRRRSEKSIGKKFLVSWRLCGYFRSSPGRARLSLGSARVSLRSARLLPPFNPPRVNNQGFLKKAAALSLTLCKR